MYVEFMTLKNAQFLHMNLSPFLLTSFTIAIIPKYPNIYIIIALVVKLGGNKIRFVIFQVSQI